MLCDNFMNKNRVLKKAFVFYYFPRFMSDYII